MTVNPCGLSDKGTPPTFMPKNPVVMLIGNASTVTLADGKRLFAGSSIENEAAQ